MLPGRQLVICWLTIDGKRPGVVSKVAAVRRSKVENIQLSGLAVTVAGRAAADSAGIVVAGSGQHFAAGCDSGLLECGKHLQLSQPWPDDLPGAIVHCPSGSDRPP
jgi:hypothetical protein